MKIGILTFHYGSNYGGVLQTYASLQILRFMGHEAYTINYRPKDKLKQFIIVIRGCLSRKALYPCFFYLSHFKKCRSVFLEFCDQYLNQTNVCHTEADLQKLCLDAIYVGSDQVWNVSQQKYSTYFLGWLTDRKIKKISYAACCGRNMINLKYRKKIASELRSFDAISVRSEETQKFVFELLGKNVPIVADPTMLYDFKEFCHEMSEDFILTYLLGDDINGGNMQAIEMIRKKYSEMPVYSIVLSDRIPKLCNWADKQLVDISPNEWVNLIFNCKILYTDSYHGCVFAMKFNKPFIAYYNDDITGRRLIDLSSQVHSKNIVSDINAVEAVLVKDEEKDYRYIENFKSKSFEYLKNSLK